MATWASDKGRTTARAVHAGTTTVVATFVWGVTNATDSATSATAAAADVLNMVKLPHGATVTRVAYTSNRDDGAYKFGTSASASLFAATVSVSAGITEATIGLPLVVSLSDDASVAYEWLNATVVSAGYTLSDYVTVICEYVMHNK